MKNTLNTLLKFINNSTNKDESTEIYENTIKSLIIDFFTKRDNKEIPHLKSLNITGFDFNLSNEDDIVEVTITLTEAGLLVGKNGNTIKQLGGYLSKNLNKRVRIYVKESTLFKVGE